jgi:hypothetical protein
MRYNYLRLQSDKTASYAISAYEDTLYALLEAAGLHAFLRDDSGISFVQTVLLSQARRDYSDWVLLSRVFQYMQIAIRTSKGAHPFYINSYTVENLVVCVENGLRQKNYREMVEFFKLVAYFAQEQQYWASLATKPVVDALFEGLRVVDLGYDENLADYYLRKVEIEAKNEQIILHHKRSGGASNFHEYDDLL